MQVSDLRKKSVDELNEEEKKQVKAYFKKTVFPMLTPMVYDNYHP